VKRDPAVILIVALIVTVMLVFGYKMARKAPVAAAHPTGLGQPAPGFSLHAVDGKTISLADFHGKAVVVNFWATWCQPCRVEMPWFVELQKRYGPEGLQIVGISVDDDSSPEDVAKFANDLNVNYPILMGQDAVENAYGGIQFLPVTVYIDREGKIVDKVFGLVGRGEIEGKIKKALGPERVTQAKK
jgi:peroxiredoxin